MQDLELTILGSSSAIPMANRSPTAQFLTLSGRHFLVDCGEGTQVKLRQHNIGFGRINHIFISHLHGDHFYGLVPLLTSLHLLDRHKEMHLYGPENLEEAVLGMLGLSGAKLRFKLVFHPTSQKEKVLLFEDEAVQVYSFPLKHRMPCCGFLFQEKPRPRSMRKDKLAQYSIPVAEIRAIKKGADWSNEQGELIPNEELTLPAPAPLSYAFCTDTAPLDHLATFFTQPDLLYHEATFTQDLQERAKKTQHSTARQAAKMAVLTQAKHLLLGHFSVRYKQLKPILKEAQEILPQSYLALEGLSFRLSRKSKKLEVKEARATKNGPKLVGGS
jgi:ribonuclease Z